MVPQLVIGYQLLVSGVLKPWSVEEISRLLTEPYQKEHKGNFCQNANNRSQRCPGRESKNGGCHGNGHLEVIASSNYRRWRSILIGKSDKLETRQVRVKISNISRNIGTAIMLTAAGISTIMLPWRSNTVTRVIRRAIMETVHNGATSLDLNQAMTFRSTRVRYIRFSKAQTERSKGRPGAAGPGL